MEKVAKKQKFLFQKVCFQPGKRFTDLFFYSFDTGRLYTSDAADDRLCVDLGGRRIIKKKKNC